MQKKWTEGIQFLKDNETDVGAFSSVMHLPSPSRMCTKIEGIVNKS